METAKQEKTENFMSGTFELKNDKVDIKIIIKKYDDEVILTHNGMQEEFEKSAHWLGEYYCFTGMGEGYYIKSADEKQLVFGKLQDGASTGNIEWEYTLNRISKLNPLQ